VPRLLVQGNITEGATIEFFVNGRKAPQTAAWHSTQITVLNLAVGTVDVTTPVAALSPLTPDPVASTTVTLTGTATDSNGNVTLVEYRLGNGIWRTATPADGTFNSPAENFTFTISLLNTGSHTVWVRATDSDGNVTPQANWASDVFIVDPLSPTLTLTPLAPDPTTDTTVTFSGTASDGQSSIALVEFRLDAGTWGVAAPTDGAFSGPSESFTFTITGLNIAPHTVWARATDAAGNITPQPNWASDSFTVNQLSGSGGGGGLGLTPTLTTVTVIGLSGEKGLKVDNSGKTPEDSRLTDPERKITLDIPSGAILKTGAGQPLNSITLTTPFPPPSPPPQYAIVLSKEFGPSGATFNPPITLTLTYTEASLPAGAIEPALVIALWDGAKWILLPTAVNTETNTLTAPVSQFTTFALLAPIQPPPRVTITSPVTGATLTAGKPVTVSVSIENFQIVAAGGTGVIPGQGHIHYYLDVDPPTTPGAPAVTTAGTYKSTPEPFVVWENVPAGTHTFSTQLVNNNHTPLEPPVMAKVTVTLQASAPPTTPPAGTTSPTASTPVPQPASTTTPTPEGTPPASGSPAAGSTNWGLFIGGVVAGAIVAGLLFIVLRRSGRK
jgi:hypothetical protein